MSRKGKRTLTIVYSFLGSLAFSGCIDQGESTYCPTGMFCPPSLSCAAKQAACILGKCGNGTLDKGEVCDDGNMRCSRLTPRLFGNPGCRNGRSQQATSRSGSRSAWTA